MTIDLTCPVELWQYAMPVEDASECTFVLNNLSNKVVTSVFITLSCFNQENNLLFRQSERVQGLRAGVGERFSIMVMPSQWKDVSGVDLSIEKVWFDDATIWRRGNAPLIIYTPNNLPNGRALDELRFVAGQDAVGYPVKQEEVWLCVCGRVNPADSMRCCRCERMRESTFASFNRENVAMMIAVHEQKLTEVAREARQENSRLVEEHVKERQRQKRKRRNIIKWSLTGLTTAAACVVMIVWVIPAMRYGAAEDLLKNGQYEDAHTAFASMGTYQDAGARLLECDYGQAAQLLDKGDEESLLSAEAAFKALGEYEDSAANVQEASYRLGGLYLKQKLFDKAMDVFQSLGSYKDSADMCNRCTYEQAQELFENGNESVALALFASIPQYQDSSTRAQACYYTMAQKQLEEDNAEEAARLFGLAGDYEDAAERHDSTVYQIATAKLESGDQEGAGIDFLSISAYLDAQAKGEDCLYQYAAAQLQQGSYEAAAAAFDRVSGYLDSEGQANVSRYQQAAALMDNGDYATAAPLLERTGGYENSAALLNQCYYQLAQTAIAEGDNVTAERLLELLGGYENSAVQLRTVRYQAAEDALAAQNYSEAMTRYEALGSFKDSADKYRQCQYALAQQLFNDGDYAQAAAGFAALGNYEDSASWLRNTYDQQATAFETANDLEGALQLLPQAAEGSEAYTKLVALLLNEGARLAGEGELTAAAQWYQRMGDAGQEAYRDVSYQSALKMMQNGDIKSAADAFLQLGDYGDAAAQARQCYSQLYGEQATTARQAMDDSDYRTAIIALRDIDRTVLPQGYTDLTALYERACYEYAEQLYKNGEPYRALPFYIEAGEYSDAADKLTRRAYLVLGAWQSASGSAAVFRSDGICELEGKKLYFKVNNFSLLTGESPDTLAVTHQFNTLTAKGMSIRNIAARSDYKYEKIGEAEIPAMDLAEVAKPVTISATTAADEGAAASVTETPAPTAGGDEAAATATSTPSATEAPTVTPSPTSAANEFQVTED